MRARKRAEEEGEERKKERRRIHLLTFLSLSQKFKKKLNHLYLSAVKLTSISIKAPDAEMAPRKVRVFVNRPSLGFSEAESDPAEAEFELTAEAATEGRPQALRVAKFASVSSVALFFADNLGGGEVTRVSAIALEGSAGETFNVAEIKKVGEEGGAGA